MQQLFQLDVYVPLFSTYPNSRISFRDYHRPLLFFVDSIEIKNIFSKIYSRLIRFKIITLNLAKMLSEVVSNNERKVTDKNHTTRINRSDNIACLYTEKRTISPGIQDQESFITHCSSVPLYFVRFILLAFMLKIRLIYSKNGKNKY